MSSASAEDYLKTILFLARGEATASTSAIADQMRVAAPSVSGMLKRLADRGLVEHVPYYGARLTEAGEREAVRLVRRHRMIELYLVRMLGYEWDRVHEEAERLEHVVSDELVERMAAVLGQPAEDPHGSPIPGVGEVLEATSLPVLTDLSEGDGAILREVPDSDPEVLRYLAKLKLFPGKRLKLLERAPFGGPLRVGIEGAERYIGAELAALLRVEPEGEDRDRPVAARRSGGSSRRGVEHE